MAANRKDSEFQYYTSRVGISYPPNARVEDMKKIYWAKITGSCCNKNTATDLQVKWLHSLTGVGANTVGLADLWREAVVGIGQKPGNFIEENEWLYYTFGP